MRNSKSRNKYVTHGGRTQTIIIKRLVIENTPTHTYTKHPQQGSSHLPPPTAHNRAEARKEVNGQSMLGTNYIACCGKRGRNKIGTRHHSNMMPERPPNARKTDFSSHKYRDENSCRPIGIVLRSSRSAAHQPKNRGEKTAVLAERLSAWACFLSP